MIRLSEVHLSPEAETLVLGVLRSGRLAQGPMVQLFEKDFAAFAGTTHAVAVNNGTTALVAALEAVGVGPGDEVITTPFTFVATLNAILERGARARLADIRHDDYTIDVAALEAAITPATRAIVPVHLYGYPADMTTVEKLAERHDLAIVEDAAQAHGATVEGRGVGSFGTGAGAAAGCFSLYATKNLTTGEGGVVTTDDPAVDDRLRVLRNQGMRARYVYEVAGHNYRMTELQAAVGVAELGLLAGRTERRRANAARLNEGLAGIEGLGLPPEAAGRRHVYHQYTVRIGLEARLGRDTLIEGLSGHGIESGVYYPRPLHAYDCYRSHSRVLVESVPEAERASREVLSLPVHPWLADADVDHIVTTVRALLA